MRIALFSEVYWPMISGVGVTLLRLTRALEERGHRVRVYSATYPLPRGQSDRPEVHRSPSVPFFLYPDVQWAFPRLRDVVDDLVRFNPDVVHVATEFTVGVAGLKAARQLGLPLIASSHTDYEKYAARYNVEWALRVGWHYLRWFYGHAHRVLCPSRIYEEHLHRRGVTHTGLWSRGVDPAVFHPRFRSDAYRQRLGLRPHDLLVTYIGRIAREKNLAQLLQAWESLAPSRGTARLALVGRGPLEEEIRRRDIPGVHVLGLMHDRQLSEAYASADIFVFPSATETFGNSLLEAMGSGLPSLAVPAGGVLEFARQGENAWLVEPNSAPALAEGLSRLLADTALRRRLTEGALQTGRERRWDEVYDRLLDDYRDTIESRGERLPASLAADLDAETSTSVRIGAG
ncbi:MAG TPA: glycosyltransferase family 1 protein [Gemmatimonadales bacterium]|nr:glycosyltransferase family 1 protein [Gemmatimonadales bacterium]